MFNSLSNILAKKAGRKLDGFHITGNPLLSRDQNGCLTFMRQPLVVLIFVSELSDESVQINILIIKCSCNVLIYDLSVVAVNA